MRELPGGTVTFLFTDIEGSTRLLRELGDGYASALARQRQTVRAAFDAHGGVEVDTQGDAFFFVFANASGAVAAAGDAQAALADGPIRVRMGLHTGTPQRTAEGYVGLEVHRAARIASAGHGGQVVLSRATIQQVDGLDALDLGQHRLKDFEEPVWLFQLTDRAFPPLRTIGNTNLPRPASTFVGREREVAEIGDLLQTNRLITLTGPGGTGKSRLAVETASDSLGQFAHGTFWVELAAVRDPTLVIPTVARTIGARNELATEIGEKHMLLVLDNLEQVIEVASDLARLVEACPNLSLLGTSRERLNVRGEVEYQIEPLATDEAVALFCARGQVSPNVAISEICRRLDNMPLAVELAAARTKVMRPEQILERLNQRLDLFKGGRDVDSRQQTLRATIQWSHDLLDETEKRLFARISVFVGGCTLEAAEAVVDAEIDDLQRLVDKSLVRHSGARFVMLETIHEFAVEQLTASGEQETMAARHADWVFADWGSFDVSSQDQDEALANLRAEVPNIRAALVVLKANHRTTDRLVLVSALAQPMFQMGAAAESKIWLEDALAECSDCPIEVRARGYLSAALQSALSGDPELGVRYAAIAADLAIGSDDDVLQADVLLAQGVSAAMAGDVNAAGNYTRKAIAVAERLGDQARIGDLRNNLAYLEISSGELDRARATAEAALHDARDRSDHHISAMLTHNLAVIAIRAGDEREAAERALEALRLSRLHELDFILCNAVELAAALAQRRGANEFAATLLGAASTGLRSAGPIEDELRAEVKAALGTSLGVSRFDELFTSGTRLPIGEAAHQAESWLSGSQSD